MTDYSLIGLFREPSHIMGLVERNVDQQFGLYQLFSRRINGNESVVTMSEFGYEIRMPKDLPENSDYSEKTQAGSSQLVAYKVPHFSIETNITAHDLQQPIPPEYVARTLSQSNQERLRRAWHVAKGLGQGVRMMIIEHERQAVSALWRGKIDFDHVPTADFKRRAENNVVAALPWSNPQAKILEDLAAMARQVVEHGGKPDMLIVGGSAYNSFINNEQIQKFLDNRRYEVGSVSGGRGNGFSDVLARIDAGGYPVTVHAYNEAYFDNTGQRRLFLDSNAVIMMDSRQPLITYMGNPALLDEFKSQSLSYGGLSFQGFSYLSPPSGVVVGIKSRPLLMLAQPNHTAVLRADGGNIG